MPKPFPSNIKSGPGQGASGKPGPQGPEGPGFAPSVDLTGNRSQQAVIGFRERPISPNPPAVGNVYAWNGTQWAPVAQSGGGNVPDPDTGSILDVLTVYGNNIPVATILISSGDFWVVNAGELGLVKPSLVRMNLSTNIPNLAVFGPNTSEEWYNIIETTENLLVIVGSNAAGNRFMRIVDVSTSTPVLGDALELGLDPITSDYGGKPPGPIAFDGSYIWTVGAHEAVSASLGGGTDLYVGPTLTLSDGGISNPTYPVWVTYDPVGANYADGFPRLWFLSSAITADTTYSAVMDRVVSPDVNVYVIDASVPISNTVVKPAEILIGGGRLFYLQEGNDGNIARIHPDTCLIEEWTILSVPPNVSHPVSFSYDSETSSLLVLVLEDNPPSSVVVANIIRSNFSTNTRIELPEIAGGGVTSSTPAAYVSVLDTTGGRGWIPTGNNGSAPGAGSLIQLDLSTHDFIVTNHYSLTYLPVVSGGSPSIPLSNTRFVDGGIATSGDGSIASPYKTLTTALVSVGSISYPGPTILVTPGDYSSESPLQWMSPGNPPVGLTLKSFAGIYTTPNVTALSGNLSVEGAYISSAIGNSVILENCSNTIVEATYVTGIGSSFNYIFVSSNLSLKHSTFERGSVIYAGSIMSYNTDNTVDTTEPYNVLRIKSDGGDYVPITVTPSASLSKTDLVNELNSTLGPLNMAAVIDYGNRIIFYSSTGYVSIDTLAHGSTLNTPLIIYPGENFPCNVTMDISTWYNFKSNSIYTGEITVTEPPPEITIINDVTVYAIVNVSAGFMTTDISTPPITPAILTLKCAAGNQVLLQLTPFTYRDPQASENIGLIVSYTWQYSINGSDWFDIGLTASYGSDDWTKLITVQLNRSYVHTGATTNVYFRVALRQVFGAVGLELDPEVGLPSMIASRL
jgi:hypothetical protein